MESVFWEYLAQGLVLLAIALFLGAVFERFRQSAILGFLLAGTLVGPGVMNLVEDPHVVATIAELGVALLLFAIGLEFSIKRLLRLGAIALVGGSLQVALTMTLGLLAARMWGVGWPVAVAIGAMGALSSTACVLRVLGDRSALESVYGRGCLGILLLQDLAVVPLVLIVAMMGGAGGMGEMAYGIGRAVLLIVAMLGGFYIFSNYLLPHLLQSSVARRNRELLILLATLLAFGATWVSHSLGLSPALGAFLAGIMLAESPFALQIRSDVGALRTLFVTLFFISIGMLGEPMWIIENWLEVSIAVVAVVLGKGALITCIGRLFGLGWRPAVAMGVCLAQVGEFSFVIARVAADTQLPDGGPMIDEHTFRLVVSATLVTLFLTPYLVAAAPSIGLAVERLFTGKSSVDDESKDAHTPPSQDGHVIIVGFGPAGQAVATALQHNNVPITIVDSNPANIAKSRSQGFATQLADACSSDLWAHLHIDNAGAVIVTLPDYQTSAAVVHLIRAEAAHVPVLVRSRYSMFAAGIRAAGAHSVVDEELTVGKRLSELAVELITKHQ